VALDLVDELAEQVLGDLEVGDHPVLQRADGANLVGRTTEHGLGLGTHCQHAIAGGVDGNDGGFVHHHAAALDEDKGIRRAEVDGDVGGEKSSQAVQPVRRPHGGSRSLGCAGRQGGRSLTHALRASRRKIFVFLYAVMILVIIIGSLMYLIEGEQSGFTSIPRSIYWAIVTLTTVGYGDIAPSTNLGQTLAAIVMIIGYGIIAVPTGIVTAELARESRQNLTAIACPECSAEGHDRDAIHCKYCGAKL